MNDRNNLAGRFEIYVQDMRPGWPQTPTYQWWRRHDEYGTPS